MRTKRVIAMLLVATMLTGLLAGCGSKTETSQAETTEAAAETSEDKLKIGVIFYSKDDALGQSVVSVVDYAAEVLGNVEVEWNICGTEPTDQIAAAENLIAAGCDGIMSIPMSDTVSYKTAQACESAGIKVAYCFRDIHDEAMREEVEAMECYVGQCQEDEAGTAKAMVEYMVEQGYGKFGIGYVNPAHALIQRNVGVDEGLAETGAEKLAEYTIPDAMDPQQHVSAINNFASAYPNMDAVILTSTSQGGGEAVYNAVLSSGKDMKIAAFDTFDGMMDGFEKDVIKCIVGGMYPDALFTFMALYNAVDGNPLSDEPIHLSQGYLLIRNAEECEVYDTYVADPDYRIYNEEAIKSMAVRYNEELTLESFQALQADFSMDYVLSTIE